LQPTKITTVLLLLQQNCNASAALHCTAGKSITIFATLAAAASESDWQLAAHVLLVLLYCTLIVW
jgi:hypothetical protein